MSTFRHVVTNAGPLMVLAKLHAPFLLADLYSTVHIPFSVYQEVVIQGLRQGYEDARIVQKFIQAVGWRPEEVPSSYYHPPLLCDAHLDRGGATHWL